MLRTICDFTLICSDLVRAVRSQKNPVSPVECALTNFAFVSTFRMNTYEHQRIHFKTINFKSIRMRTYEICARNSFRMRTYRKRGWGGDSAHIACAGRRGQIRLSRAALKESHDRILLLLAEAWRDDGPVAVVASSTRAGYPARPEKFRSETFKLSRGNTQ